MNNQDKPAIVLNLPANLWGRMVDPGIEEALQQMVDFGGERPRPTIDVEELLKQAQEAAIMVTSWGSHPLSSELLTSFPRLELIIHAAGSIRKVFPSPPSSDRIRICSAVELNARPVAEFTLGIILCALRDTFGWRDRFRREGPRLWWRYRDTYEGGYQGKSVCLVGFGAVARRLCILLRNFGFKVYVVSDYITDQEKSDYSVRKTSLAWAATNCDILSIHEADLPKNRHMVDRRILENMKPGAWLINTARGSLVDEEALIKVLESRKIWALLDVAQSEPPPPGHPFYTLPNCILTPHIAGSLGNELLRFGDYILREIRNHLSDRSYESELKLSSIPYRA